ncbi:radical SAM protein, partial [Aliarcobacter butzleri]|nr:radical SAM protein [Aliarcobacter butzleri]
NSIIFGPIPSRRFGISLGIDLSPSKKQCNFDCLYCELEGAKTVDKMDTFPSVDEIIKAIKESFKNHPKIDVITITCNGEPTLYPKLSELIDEINKIKGETKTLILSNGSTIYKKEIFEALLKIDIVKLSLDCVSEKCFKKLDRQNKSVEIEKIVPSMIEFSQKTKKDFVLE